MRGACGRFGVPQACCSGNRNILGLRLALDLGVTEIAGSRSKFPASNACQAGVIRYLAIESPPTESSKGQGYVKGVAQTTEIFDEMGNRAVSKFSFP